MEEIYLSNPEFFSFARTLLSGTTPCSIKFRVDGFSMYPFLQSGDVILIAPPSIESPGVGDIVVVTFPHSNKTVVHRVVRVKRGRYQVKGDNLASPDGWFKTKAVLGVVNRVHRDGYGYLPILFWKSPFIAVLSRCHLLFPLQLSVRIVEKLLGRKERHDG